MYIHLPSPWHAHGACGKYCRDSLAGCDALTAKINGWQQFRKVYDTSKGTSISVVHCQEWARLRDGGRWAGLESRPGQSLSMIQTGGWTFNPLSNERRVLDGCPFGNKPIYAAGRLGSIAALRRSIVLLISAPIAPETWFLLSKTNPRARQSLQGEGELEMNPATKPEKTRRPC